MRLLAALILALTLPAGALAADSEAIATRAARAYVAGEWAGAQALYGLVADSDPSSAPAAAHLIVSAEMRADTTVASGAIDRYMRVGAPLGDLLGQLEDLSFSLGRAGMYESLLLRLARQMPYLRRPLALRLLHFYMFRGNPSQTIEYATMLLRGQPGDPLYLNAMGQAYMTLGDVDSALQCFADALAGDPDNLEALTALGNYYAASDDAATALPYLRRAAAIAPSPYLDGEIARLQNLHYPPLRK